MSKEMAPQSEAFQDEKDAWKKVLGVEVDIQPLPASVTPEVNKNLEEMGMELRFIPALNLGTLEDLKKEGEESYLNNLQLRYPNWRKYESLNDMQCKDYSIARNLEKRFWKSIKDGKIDFPQLSGTWMAVEAIPKPDCYGHYKDTISKIREELGFLEDEQFNWDDANSVISRCKRDVLNEIGLFSGDIRMLEAIEWNLLANRESWGKTNTCEWTNTEFYRSDESHHVIVGNSDYGGAANADECYSGSYDYDLRFRVAVILDPSPQLIVNENIVRTREIIVESNDKIMLSIPSQKGRTCINIDLDSDGLLVLSGGSDIVSRLVGEGWKEKIKEK